MARSAPGPRRGRGGSAAGCRTVDFARGGGPWPEAGTPEWTANSFLTYADGPFSVTLSGRYISEGIFDQWAGIPMEQALAKRGLGQMKSVHHTRSLTSQMFQNFKDMMLDKRLVLFDWPKPEGEEHAEYLQELLELQAEVISKYVILVSAPNMDGKHDDYADALARMVWVATAKAGKPVTITGVHSSRSLASMSRTVSPVGNLLRLKRTGSHPDRMVPKARNKKNRW